MTEYIFTANYQPIKEQPIVISFDELHKELYDKGWTVHWEFNSDIDPALLKYNHCTTYTECRTVDANVATDVENGVWNYRLDNLETGGFFYQDQETYQITVDGLFMIDGGSTPNDSLKSFNVDLPNLTNGSGMFGGCTGLTSFSSDLPKLDNGSFMFGGCTGLTQWTVDLPKLDNGGYMFAGCTNLTSWTIALPNLTNGFAMFTHCTGLTKFSGNLSSLINGDNMFTHCTGLTQWTVDLPKLDNGSFMFLSCSSLTSFSGDLSSLTDVSFMFDECTNLTEFNGDLLKLDNGGYMFVGCTNLTSFTSNLPNLTNGYRMFGQLTSDCTKLNLASVQNIAETINTITDITSNSSTGLGYISIGISSSIQDTAELETALAAIRAKGWTVVEMYA